MPGWWGNWRRTSSHQSSASRSPWCSPTNRAAGAPLLRKEVRVNGVSRHAIDLVGRMPTVLFLPRNVELISGTPSVRRRYLDIALCQMQHDYCRRAGQLQQGVGSAQRAAQGARRAGAAREQLAFWDEQLVAHGSLLMSAAPPLSASWKPRPISASRH